MHVIQDGGTFLVLHDDPGTAGVKEVHTYPSHVSDDDLRGAKIARDWFVKTVADGQEIEWRGL